MKKFVCTVCGYVYEGEESPEECPVCHQPASKFKEEEVSKKEADKRGEPKEVEAGVSEHTDLSYDKSF